MQLEKANWISSDSLFPSDPNGNALSMRSKREDLCGLMKYLFWLSNWLWYFLRLPRGEDWY